MNTTKLLNLVMETEAACKENYNAYKAYLELYNMITDEIGKEAEKAAGRKPNIRNAAKNFLSKDNFRPVLQKAQYFELDGVPYYGLCDGFRLAWSKYDFGFEVEKERPINVTTLVDVNARNLKNPEIITVDKAEVIRTIKEAKAAGERRIVYTLVRANGTTILVNANYLKDALDFTETDEIFVDGEAENKPVYLYGKDDKNAPILPIRK